MFEGRVGRGEKGNMHMDGMEEEGERKEKWKGN